MDNGTTERTRIKQSFNLEHDVARLLARWQRLNPMVIKSRVFNAALRDYLAKQSRKEKVAA